MIKNIGLELGSSADLSVGKNENILSISKEVKNIVHLLMQF